MLSRKLKASIVGLLAAGLIACTPSQIQTSESLITVILQDVPPILTMLAGFGVLAQPQLTQAQAAAGQASGDFSLALSLIKQYQATPSTTTAQKIQAALGDAQANLNAILTAAHVLNPQSRDQITGAVTLIINTASQIAAVFPTAATTSAVKASNAVKLPSVNSFQKQFHAFIP